MPPFFAIQFMNRLLPSKMMMKGRMLMRMSMRALMGGSYSVMICTSVFSRRAMVASLDSV